MDNCYALGYQKEINMITKKCSCIKNYLNIAIDSNRTKCGFLTDLTALYFEHPLSANLYTR